MKNELKKKGPIVMNVIHRPEIRAAAVLQCLYVNHYCPGHLGNLKFERGFSHRKPSKHVQARYDC